MIHLFLSALLWWQHRSLDQISRNNIARKEAEAAYKAANYARAAERYTFLTRIDSTPNPDLLLNLGHSCFRLNRYAPAKVQYERLRQIGNAEQVSIASVQLGIIACLEKDSATALNLFQQALLENSDNEPARHNFELIKRIWSGRTPTAGVAQRPKPNPAKVTVQRPTPAESKQAPAPTVAHSERKDDQLRRFRNLNMTEAQARQLLDAMQGDDLPYTLARHRAPARDAEPGNRW